MISPEAFLHPSPACITSTIAWPSGQRSPIKNNSLRLKMKHRPWRTKYLNCKRFWFFYSLSGLDFSQCLGLVQGVDLGYGSLEFDPRLGVMIIILQLYSYFLKSILCLLRARAASPWVWAVKLETPSVRPRQCMHCISSWTLLQGSIHKNTSMRIQNTKIQKYKNKKI